MRHLAICLGWIVACLPLTFVVTFLLMPLWSWIEATKGIESVGHSGPADWCFETVFALLIALGLITYWLLARRRPVK